MVSLSSCNYVYDPTTVPRDQSKFTVYFESKGYDSSMWRQSQLDRCRRVQQHLQTLDRATLEDESAQFFKWLVLYHLSASNRDYAKLLLEFFHSNGLLLGKRTVDNPVKQLKHRYLVVFSMGKHVFAKRYNSIRELKIDTGKRPSQIHAQRRKTFIVCQKLVC